MKPALAILAAGMGSRYGGLKQIDPVGPHGELVIDYSIFDAVRAGFGRIVFVIRRDIEKDFREAIGHRLEKHADVHYAFQEKPVGRAKPWGTGHATLSARGAADGNFGLINADDFYGPSAYQLLSRHFEASTDYCMVGFKLRQTLSEHGSVARGLCRIDAAGFLQHVTEVPKIAGLGDGLTGDEIVSMNCWGFTPSIFDHLQRQFDVFAREKADDPKAEMYLPSAVDRLIQEGRARVRVLLSPDAWLGVTYQQDRPTVMAGIRKLIADGIYPSSLWA
jgi:NDP-sugar pyrophosphorylase family protein